MSNLGDKVYFRAKTENQTFSKDSALNYYKFIAAGWSNNISITGNIQTLLKADGSRTDAPEFCYNQLFFAGNEWTSAPSLPATTLGASCYAKMFYGCTSLTTAPALPATTLASGCYANMFYGCTSLTSAPALPATTLAYWCCGSMFYGCTSLTSAPALPATTLADSCYASMFRGCTSLTSAPELPATALINECYADMFNGCTSLSSVDVSFTAWSPTNATNSWLNNVAASGTFTCPAGLPAQSGASGIPDGWTRVDAA